MQISPADLPMGTQVYDCNKEKIGAVNEIISGSTTTASSGDGGASHGQNGSSVESYYFELAEGSIWELGSKLLYVPFAAIHSIEQGKGAYLNCTKAEAESKYQDKPAFLKHQ